MGADRVAEIAEELKNAGRSRLVKSDKDKLSEKEKLKAEKTKQDELAKKLKARGATLHVAATEKTERKHPGGDIYNEIDEEAFMDAEEELAGKTNNGDIWDDTNGFPATLVEEVRDSQEEADAQRYAEEQKIEHERKLREEQQQRLDSDVAKIDQACALSGCSPERTSMAIGLDANGKPSGAVGSGSGTGIREQHESEKSPFTIEGRRNINFSGPTLFAEVKAPASINPLGSPGRSGIPTPMGTTTILSGSTGALPTTGREVACPNCHVVAKNLAGLKVHVRMSAKGCNNAIEAKELLRRRQYLGVLINDRGLLRMRKAKRSYLG